MFFLNSYLNKTMFVFIINLFLVFIFHQHPIECIGPGLSKLSHYSTSSLPGSNSGSQHYSTDVANSYAYWNCHTIPPNMTLCKGVGYSRMVLPNFLQHESIREAIQQANVWVSLVNTDCHPDIQRFLCALYAPVCLKSHQEAKIPPCWEMCTDVRNACLPRMRLFGFDWPDIVKCEQFPRLAESMCIPSEQNTGTCFYFYHYFKMEFTKFIKILCALKTDLYLFMSTLIFIHVYL